MQTKTRKRDPDTIAISEQPDGIFYTSTSLDGRPLWKAFLTCENGNPTQLVYENQTDATRIKIKQTETGITQKCRTGTLPIAVTGGVFPPDLVTPDGLPTKNHTHIRGIHAFFQNKY